MERSHIHSLMNKKKDFFSYENVLFQIKHTRTVESRLSTFDGNVSTLHNDHSDVKRRMNIAY